MGIDKTRTTAYEPRTNGMIERWHRTLNAMLGKVVREHQKDWCERLPYVMAAYRATEHDVTGFTPNYLFLGREVYSPIDLTLGAAVMVQNLSLDAYVDRLEEQIREAYALVRTTTGKYVERQKYRYDLRVKPVRFRRGDWVWYYYPRQRVGKSRKWAHVWTGPYLVVRMLNPLLYEIQPSRRGKIQRVHIDKLKKFEGDLPVSWLLDDEENVGEFQGVLGDVGEESDAEEGVAEEAEGMLPEEEEEDLGRRTIREEGGYRDLSDAEETALEVRSDLKEKGVEGKSTIRGEGEHDSSDPETAPLEVPFDNRNLSRDRGKKFQPGTSDTRNVHEELDTIEEEELSDGLTEFVEETASIQPTSTQKEERSIKGGNPSAQGSLKVPVRVVPRVTIEENDEETARPKRILARPRRFEDFIMKIAEPSGGTQDTVGIRSKRSNRLSDLDNPVFVGSLKRKAEGSNRVSDLDNPVFVGSLASILEEEEETQERTPSEQGIETPTVKEQDYSEITIGKEGIFVPKWIIDEKSTRFRTIVDYVGRIPPTEIETEENIYEEIKEQLLEELKIKEEVEKNSSDSENGLYHDDELCDDNYREHF